MQHTHVAAEKGPEKECLRVTISEDFLLGNLFVVKFARKIRIAPDDDAFDPHPQEAH